MINKIQIELLLPKKTTVTVELSLEASNDEMIEQAKLQFMKKMDKNFESYIESVTSDVHLSVDTAKIGMLVENKERIGVVTKINQSRIAVATSKGMEYYRPSEWQVSTKELDCLIRCLPRRKTHFYLDECTWSDKGTLCYYWVEEKSEYVPVVLGHMTARFVELVFLGKEKKKKRIRKEESVRFLLKDKPIVLTHR